MQTTVVVVEDNPEFRHRFVEIVKTGEEFALAGIAATGAEGIALIDQGRADIYLVDLGLPDLSGIDVIRHAVEKYPDVEVMVITVFGDEQHVIESIEAGATGYLLKDSSAQEVLTSLRTLRDGGSVVSPAIARKVLQRFQEKKLPAPAADEAADEAADQAADQAAGAQTPTQMQIQTQPVPDVLSEREVQVLKDLSKGMSYKEIAADRFISAHTVACHVKSIYRKLTVTSRGEAVYEAARRGLISL